MNHKDFEEMIKRLQANTKNFSNIETEVTEEGVDRVVFDIEYPSMDELDMVQKKLRIARFPEAFSDGTPISPIMAGKITICEYKTCLTCRHSEWKNVTKEIQIKLLGGIVPGW